MFILRFFCNCWWLGINQLLHHDVFPKIAVYVSCIIYHKLSKIIKNEKIQIDNMCFSAVSVFTWMTFLIQFQLYVYLPCLHVPESHFWNDFNSGMINIQLSKLITNTGLVYIKISCMYVWKLAVSSSGGKCLVFQVLSHHKFEKSCQ